MRQAFYSSHQVCCGFRKTYNFPYTSCSLPLRHMLVCDLAITPHVHCSSRLRVPVPLTAQRAAMIHNI